MKGRSDIPLIMDRLRPSNLVFAPYLKNEWKEFNQTSFMNKPRIFPKSLK